MAQPCFCAHERLPEPDRPVFHKRGPSKPMPATGCKVGWDRGADRDSLCPTSPRSPLRFRTVGFPQYGSKAGLSDGPSLIAFRLSWLPACPSREAGLLPSFVLSAAAWVLRSESETTCSVEHRHASDMRRSTPGALAPVQVVLSWSINTYSAPSAPLAGTSQLHRTATYMECLRRCGSASATREWFRAFAANVPS